MKLEIINGIRVITPDENMWLCNENDKVITDKVHLGINADETMWRDITEEDKSSLEVLWNEETLLETEATETDYINALGDLGVQFNG